MWTCRLGRNRLNALKDLRPLKTLSHLVNLDFLLGNTALSQLPHARLYTVFSLPSLTVLDAAPITLSDRQNADARFNRDEVEMMEKQLSDERVKSSELTMKVNELQKWCDAITRLSVFFFVPLLFLVVFLLAQVCQNGSCEKSA